MRRRAWRVAAVALAGGAVLGLGVVACRPRPPLEVPPPTTARPADVPLWSGPAGHPHLKMPPAPDAGASDAGASDAGAAASAPGPAPGPEGVQAGLAEVRFVSAGTTLEGRACTRLAITAVRGSLSVSLGGASPAALVLARGDALVVTHPPRVELGGAGLGVAARYPVAAACAPEAAPKTDKVVVRATAAPELRFAKGAMRAHLDVGAKVSPELYLGRLEGAAPVAEHAHAGSYEILAAVEAAGTLTLGGVEQRLGPEQLVVVPPDAKHAWKPDPGSSLVAVQMYMPPGPEQRFLALAAGERDAGAPPSARAAGARP